jgi:hypothetical protein
MARCTFGKTTAACPLADLIAPSYMESNHVSGCSIDLGHPQSRKVFFVMVPGSYDASSDHFPRRNAKI